MRKKIAIVCMAVLLVIYLAGIFAPLIAPYDYSETEFTAIRKPPSWEHWAGTDFGGRDVFTRVLWGIQNTVIITLVVMATGGLLIGITLGLISGYFSSKVDGLIMRTGELFASFPDILLVIILAYALRPSLTAWARWVEDNIGIDGIVRSGVVDYFTVSLAAGLLWLGRYGTPCQRTGACTQADAVRRGGAAAGAGTARVMFVHLLPNVISIIVRQRLGRDGCANRHGNILSWLGLGIQPPRPSLGQMLLQAGSLCALREVPVDADSARSRAWSLVLAWNLLGDSLNDVLNPHTR